MLCWKKLVWLCVNVLPVCLDVFGILLLNILFGKCLFCNYLLLWFIMFYYEKTQQQNIKPLTVCKLVIQVFWHLGILLQYILF